MSNMETEIQIDGSQGEGGGQIVRSSLALSLITGRSFTIENIRANRRQPGLALQHLTAVQAAARIGNAEVSGDKLRSNRISFRPNEYVGGHFEFPIQTAGSSTLVLQTVLPALMIAEGESTVVVTGGTHNQMAPPYDFIANTYAPIIRAIGPEIELNLDKHGFYPAGGGQITMQICPSSSLGPINMVKRGQLISKQVRAIVSRLPRKIAQREIDTFQSKSGWRKSCFDIVEIAQPFGPGNVMLIELEFENLTEVIAGFGERGVSAENVAQRAWRETKAFLESEVPVGEYLADQLLLPMGIGAHLGTGGGTILTGPLSEHSKTHLDILQRFLNMQSEIEEVENGFLITIGQDKDCMQSDDSDD